MRRHFPLHIHMSTLFVALIILVGGLIGGFGYSTSRSMLEATVDDLTTRITRETLGELRHVLEPAEMAVNLFSHDPIATAGSLRERMPRIRLGEEALRRSEALSSIYVGYASGDFFYMRRLADATEREAFQGPPNSAYLVQSIERVGAAPRGRYLYLDKSLRVIREDERPDLAAAFDPRNRDWYQDAAATVGQIKTAPYLFFSNIASRRKVGITIARQSTNGDAVIGADILLDTLSASMAKQKVTRNSHSLLINQKGETLAFEDMSKLVTLPPGPDAKPRLALISELGLPELIAVKDWLADIKGDAAVARRTESATGPWRITIKPVHTEGSEPLLLVSAIPDQELLATALEMRKTSILLTLLIIVTAIPITIYIARSISGPLRLLVAEAETVRRFDFERPIAIESRILEVDDLARTMDGMKRTIRRFLAISQAVAAEENFDKLLPMLLGETLSAAEADAGIMFLVDGETLVPMCLRYRAGEPPVIPLIPSALDAVAPLLRMAATSGVTRCGPLQEDDIALTNLQAVVEELGTRQGLALPLMNRKHQLVGAMLLLRKDPFGDAQVSFINALSGSAASSLETRELIKAQKELFEAFIQLIAGAIDAKSPYTGGHCARVPELTKMLARAACAETAGPFADFTLAEDEWEAIHVASWLHDCGKVTTPEYVVDKATKLETIYDRIHEVRMRFEVLKCDARIRFHEAIRAGTPEPEAQAALDQALQRIDDDYRFIATCNEGGEFMAPDKSARLKEIAQLTWTRTLDDRIGISQEEKQRKQRTPAPELPVSEPLLADKAEHLFERRLEDRMPEDNKWGFRLKVPELLYNKGELYNLSVARGTLSEEERFKINEHIVQTVIMLMQLPFPKHMRSVPEIAGGHHEKMDGTGYPKGLTRDEMTPVARMMVIADVFEALTAVDRPYKKGKTLSEAIKIMSFMNKDQHLDPDLFKLFLRSGVYLDYARRFMKPDQIDEVDVSIYL